MNTKIMEKDIRRAAEAFDRSGHVYYARTTGYSMIQLYTVDRSLMDFLQRKFQFLKYNKKTTFTMQLGKREHLESFSRLIVDYVTDELKKASLQYLIQFCNEETKEQGIRGLNGVSIIRRMRRHRTTIKTLYGGKADVTSE